MSTGQGRLTSQVRIDHGSSVAKVVQYVRDAIVAGDLWPNQRLVETDLATQLGMSRTPVREAIRELSRLGLVRIVRNRGTYVLPVDSKELQEIYATRSVLEGWAAGLAAAEIPTTVIDELEGLNQKMGQLLVAGQYSDLIPLNDEFHRRLYEHCGNDLLRELIANLVERTPAVRRALWRSKQVMSSSVKTHAELIRALRARDSELAEKIVRSHIGWGTPERTAAPGGQVVAAL